MSQKPTPQTVEKAPDPEPSIAASLLDALWGLVSILFGIAAVTISLKTDHLQAAEMTALAGLLLTNLAILIWWFTSKLDLRIHSLAMLLNTAALAVVYFSTSQLQPAINDSRALFEDLGVIGEKKPILPPAKEAPNEGEPEKELDQQNPGGDAGGK